MLTALKCRTCDAVLSFPLRLAEWQPLTRVEGREHYTYGPSTMARGTYAIDPDPYLLGNDGSGTAREDLPTATNTVVINPLDGQLLRPHWESSRISGCCRRDGLGGPNLLCARCGTEVGVEISDCWTEYDVRLLRTMVSEEPAEDGTGTPNLTS
ncbi:hypothetical protein [Streptomyces sp. NPDC127114]|uniref:hypothetical protein n=1 Tax=Streptomyces sp. NPDC127114 TaxID=3345366 RepID=UPI003632CF29